jgi:pilus assembly protein CpaE
MADVAEARDRDSAGSLKFLACIGDEVTRETVTRVVSHLGALEAKVRAGDLASARKAIDPKAPPDLMLLDISGSADPVAMLDELMQLCPRATRVLVIGSVNDVSLYRSLTSLGVIDYLVKPVSGEVLHDALAAMLDDRGPDGGGGLQTRITAFLGGRGGIGTTSIAVATAWYFVHEFHQRAALIDLDLHFGTLALGLDLEPGRGLREALEHPERIDSLLISSAMSSGANDRLKVLAGEEALDETIRFNNEGFRTLFELLGSDFDQLVLDLPRALDDGSRHVISNVDSFVLVTDLSLAGLRDALRIIDLAKRIGTKASPLVVASQAGAPHRGEISQREFERGLGQSLDHVISYDPKAAVSMARHGKAMPETARTSKAAEEILALAQRLSGRESAKKRSIIGRLWK